MAAKIQGVILDVDGTLVDSNDAHARSYVEAMRENGIDVSYEDVRRAIGMGGDNLLPTVAHVEKDSEQGKKITKRRGEIFKAEYRPHLKPFPDVRALLERMRGGGLKLVISSSAESDELQSLLEIAGVTDLIDETVSSKDVQSSKPAPDPIVVALKKGGLAPDSVYMLGDTPYDIASAAKAGVRTLAVRCGGWGHADLKDAAAIYADPADLLAQYDRSPLRG